MQDVYQKIRDVAATDNTTVLVTGESGTGKELVASAVHLGSARHNKPLIEIDCTAIPVALLESELFGHEKGSFTSVARPGHERRGPVDLGQPAAKPQATTAATEAPAATEDRRVA